MGDWARVYGTTKWSQHQNITDVSNCTLTYDGNWKLDHSKCCYENKWINCNEFGDIQTGCLNTPMKKSNFCHEHQNYKNARSAFFIIGITNELCGFLR
jgi:hypothetical protein